MQERVSGSSRLDPPVCHGLLSSAGELDTGDAPQMRLPAPPPASACPLGLLLIGAVSPGTVRTLTHNSLQGACPWPSRAHPKQKSAAPTTTTGRAASPTCPCCPVTTASWSSTTSSTSRAAPSLPGSQVGDTQSGDKRGQVAGWVQSPSVPGHTVTVPCQVTTRCACPT